MGAQKNTVLGPACLRMRVRLYTKGLESSPAGWFMNEENLETLADAAAPDILERRRGVVKASYGRDCWGNFS